MDKKTKRNLRLYRIMIDKWKWWLSYNPFLYFLFGNKPAVELNVRGRLEKNDVFNIVEPLLKFYTSIKKKKGKLYGAVNRVEGNKEKIESIFISKKDLDAKRLEKDNAYTGKILGFPECCVKKFCSERKSGSLIPALRYLRQCSELRVKDKFGINLIGTDVTLDYGFVPCSPKCKNALKIKEECDEIYREIFGGK